MENKTSKYFKYAIGEIVLVVIGILIALSINTWNEEQKERAIIKSVLKNIRYDLIADTLRFSRDLEKIPNLVNNAKSLLNYTFQDTVSANALFDKLPYSAVNFKFKNQSYQKVINAGITEFYEFNALFDNINTYYTIDANNYDAITKWDADETTDDGKLWTAMDFEIDIYEDEFYKANEIKFEQTEDERKSVFLEQLKKPIVRNSIKMNLYRKMRVIEVIQDMKQKATTIISKIDEQLKQ